MNASDGLRRAQAAFRRAAALMGAPVAHSHAAVNGHAHANPVSIDKDFAYRSPVSLKNQTYLEETDERKEFMETWQRDWGHSI